jgi:hypothetical protein
MKRRHAGLPAFRKRPSLRTRITPADGNDTEMSSDLIGA